MQFLDRVWLQINAFHLGLLSKGKMLRRDGGFHFVMALRVVFQAALANDRLAKA